MQTVDAYCEHLGVRALEATARRAVVEQPPVHELDNHVGVRHASALYAAAFAASRALVVAAAGERAVSMVATDIEYKRLPSGSITSVAEPSGDGWSRLAGDEPVELGTTVTSRNEDGGVTVQLTATWRVG